MQRRHLVLGAAALLCAAGGRIVDGPNALEQELQSARGGETFALAPGNYGALTLNELHFDTAVTLTAADPTHPPVFSKLVLRLTTGLIFDSLSVVSEQNPPRALVLMEASREIALLNVRINGPVPQAAPIRGPEFGLLATENCETISIRGGSIAGTRHGIALFGAKNAVVEHVIFGEIGEDTIKLGAVRDVRIAYVTGPPRLWPGPEAHADFVQVQGTASENLEIVGNIFAPAGRPVAQGIFVAGQGGHRQVLIAGNLLYLANANGIFVRGTEGIQIRANTVINAGSTRGVSRIAVDGQAQIEDNIVTDRRLRALGSNFVMQRDDPAGPNYMGDAFPNLIGIGDAAPLLESLHPAPGSAATGHGAMLWVSQ